ncbi:MAG: mechanosensitive ion channel family protein [Porticoccaceae bacterium]|nr:mechanosensitive ion channel family protein [Porticoccaceae bacterium]
MLEQFGLSTGSMAFTFDAPMMRLLGSTLALFVAIAIIRALSTRFIRRTVTAPDLRRRWLVQSRNGIILLLLLGLVMIWGNELRALALSIVAIAVAFVVATKELILCISGSILKSSARSFNIGDRIQVKDFRGDVIDQKLLTTTILEVGPGKNTYQRTGRMVVIPNAIFVSEAVVNESVTQNYVLHIVSVPFKREDNWRAAQEALLDAANRHCQPYLEKARRYMGRISEQLGLIAPSVDPRVTIEVPKAGEIHLVLRFPSKAAERDHIEQAILSDVFGNNDFSAKSASPTNADPEEN